MDTLEIHIENDSGLLDELNHINTVGKFFIIITFKQIPEVK